MQALNSYWQVREYRSKIFSPVEFHRSSGFCFTKNKLLKKLYNNKKIGTILLEAGGCLVREFLKAGLVDEWVGFYAPIIIGGGTDGVAPGPFLEHEAHLEQPVVNIFGDDVCIRGDICYR